MAYILVLAQLHQYSIFIFSYSSALPPLNHSLQLTYASGDLILGYLQSTYHKERV
jgi:hypothetical protein